LEGSDFLSFQGGERRKIAVFQGKIPLESNFLCEIALENSNFPSDSLETLLGERDLHRHSENIETVRRFTTRSRTNHCI
jgi:hypothetical protein